MTEKLTDEQLRDLADHPFDSNFRAMATELLALRAEIVKNEADYKVVLDSYADENQIFHDTIEALRAERAKLEAALRDARYSVLCMETAGSTSLCESVRNQVDAALAPLAESSEPFDGPIMATLVRNNDTLRAALEPFAAAHFYYSDAGKPDDCRTGIGGVTYGDFRRAVSVLAAVAPQPPAVKQAERK
jgi:hypothetical protein